MQARPLFKDRRKFPSMADPMLQGRYPMRGLYQALAVAAMCLQEQAATRPLIGDVVTALSYLASQQYDPSAHPVGSSRFAPSTPSREKREKKVTTGSGRGGGADERARDRGSKAGSRSPALHPLASPDVRPKDGLPRGRTVNSGFESGRGQDSASARKRDSDEWDRYDGSRDSPSNSERAPKEVPKPVAPTRERERAVAEARVWGENWRERKRGTNNQGTGDDAGFG